MRVHRSENQIREWQMANYFGITAVPPVQARDAFHAYGERLAMTGLTYRAQLQPRIKGWVAVADNALRNYRFVALKSQEGREIDLKEYEYHERLYKLIQKLSRMIIKGEVYDIRDFYRVVGLYQKPRAGVVVSFSPISWFSAS
jgi:hypothetical protein